MFLCHLLICLSGAWPIYLGWQANRRTSLVHAMVWASGAWALWVLAAVAAEFCGQEAAVRYLALCLTSCAGVAVLGARRPGAGPWNLVVAALLAVLLLPAAETWVTGKLLRLDSFRAFFLAAALVVTVLNYLPTALAGAAMVLALMAGIEVAAWLLPGHGMASLFNQWPILKLWPGLLPWLAWASWRLRWPPRFEHDRLWLDFRDRYGLVWAQRVREQFNRSAGHAGLPFVLRWQGISLMPGAATVSAAMQQEMLDTLRALMRRFL